MPRTTIDIDRAALQRASAALGTTSPSATVNAALREAVRRRVLADFDVQRDIDGTPGEVALGRAARGPDGD